MARQIGIDQRLQQLDSACGPCTAIMADCGRQVGIADVELAGLARCASSQATIFARLLALTTSR